MFVAFTLKNGRAVHIDTDVVLAVEELDGGSRIHSSGISFEVKEAAAAVLEELGGEEEDEDDEDE